MSYHWIPIQAPSAGVRITQKKPFAASPVKAGGSIPDYLVSMTSVRRVDYSSNGPQNLNACYMSDDGTKWFEYSANEDLIRGYVLTTPYDISTRVFSSNNYLTFDLQGLNQNMYCMFVSNDGLDLWISGSWSVPRIYRLQMSSAWDLSTLSYSGVNSIFSAPFPSGSSGGNTFHFRPDGGQLWVAARSTSDGLAVIGSYLLNTPFDIDDTTPSNPLRMTFDEAGYPPEYGSLDNIKGITMNREGTVLLVTENNGGNPEGIHQFNMSTPWDIQTMTYKSTFNLSYTVGGQTFNPPQRDNGQIIITPDGSIVTIAGGNEDNPNQGGFWQYETNV